MEGYCMKCKKKVTMQDAKEKKNKRGIRMALGKCSKCGTTVSCILGK